VLLGKNRNIGNLTATSGRSEPFQRKSTPENIADITDVDAVTERLREVSTSDTYAELDERQRIAVKTYLDTVDGKVERW
jgi:hypothetical protein